MAVIFLVCLLYNHASAYLAVAEYTLDNWPQHIPVQKSRKDHSYGDVTRGRFELIGGFPANPFDTRHQVSREVFKKALQCVEEPHLDTIGSLPLMKLVPVQRSTIELMCAWIEIDSSWKKCLEYVQRAKTGKFEPNLENLKYTSSGGLFQVKMYRIMNNKLHLDWPWGRDRFKKPYSSVTNALLLLTSMINDLPNSVFFIGLERHFLPSNFPFPAFSNSPSFMSGDIPLPWWDPISKEINVYREIANGDRNFSGSEYSRKFLLGSNVSWEKKINKAEFYGGLSSARQIFFDCAISRPDLFDVGWTPDATGEVFSPWNPLSNESSITDDIEWIDLNPPPKTIYPSKVGYLGNLLHGKLNSQIEFGGGKYKYLVVLTGLSGLATSGRLSLFLAHSGSVVLLQNSPYLYHFSHRLKPWVHYVPISYSAADVIDKVEWLRQHDHLARRIAENAKIFSQDFLRLEDHMCYILSALETISRLENETDAFYPFDPYTFSSDNK